MQASHETLLGRMHARTECNASYSMTSASIAGGTALRSAKLSASQKEDEPIWKWACSAGTNALHVLINAKKMHETLHVSFLPMARIPRTTSMEHGTDQTMMSIITVEMTAIGFSEPSRDWKKKMVTSSRMYSEMLRHWMVTR